jgi:hypothetical protein
MTDPMDSVKNEAASLAPAVKGKADPIATLIVTARAMRDAWTHSTNIDARSHDFPAEVVALDDAWSDLDDALHALDPHPQASVAAIPAGRSASLAPEGFTAGYGEGLADAIRFLDAEWYDHHSTQRGEGAALIDDLRTRLNSKLAAVQSDVPPPTTSGSPS